MSLAFSYLSSNVSRETLQLTINLAFNLQLNQIEIVREDAILSMLILPSFYSQKAFNIKFMLR